MAKTVALDSMIFIYLFEADQRYLSFVDPLFRSIESGKTSALTSVISLIETLSPPKLLHDHHTKSEITRFFEETPHLTVYSLDQATSLLTSELRQQYPTLRTPDAIQLATALIHHADYFLTNDAKLLKLKLPHLTILPPTGLPQARLL